MTIFTIGYYRTHFFFEWTPLMFELPNAPVYSPRYPGYALCFLLLLSGPDNVWTRQCLVFSSNRPILVPPKPLCGRSMSPTYIVYTLEKPLLEKGLRTKGRTVRRTDWRTAGSTDRRRHGRTEARTDGGTNGRGHGRTEARTDGQREAPGFKFSTRKDKGLSG